MKKILLLLLVLSIATLCACRNSVIDDLPDDVIDPTSASDPSENEVTDWETPIDIDDSFEQNTEDEIDTTEGDPTEPVDVTEPTTGETTAPQNQPTQPSVTEPVITDPVVTEPVETTRPGSSGPIELPMIPG